MKNACAAIECGIEDKGVSYPATEPEVVDWDEAVPFLPSRTRRQLGLSGDREVLQGEAQSGCTGSRSRVREKLEQRKGAY